MERAIYDDLCDLSQAEIEVIKKEQVKLKSSKPKWLMVVFYFFVVIFFASLAFIIHAFAYEDKNSIDWALNLLAFSYLGYCIYPLLRDFVAIKLKRNFISNPLVSVYNRMKYSHELDMQYIGIFNLREKNELELVSIRLQVKKDKLEKTAGLFFGKLEKLGLIPGVVTLFIALYKEVRFEEGVLKDEWLFMFPFVYLFIYMLCCFFHSVVDGMTKHISLIEFVIEQKEQKKDSIPSNLHPPKEYSPSV
ncbi:hypothetical protein [uncultured Shewanella sp.]|uniref:hypothetical protein n=1 Tax=uncultured Shewanella sp. TaxID=173975 RepID=UPI00261B9C66|nr:hypothetical protein [uncultured Shewanella sp.]